ncbi:MAG TPA: hypothetical protein VMT70_10115 [Vicinamibacteria bacterium]|nr:hypothetical protein [Vicinamibacteria bacterium]
MTLPAVRVALAGALALAGCRTAAPDVPALVTSLTPESRAEITGAVSRALNGAPVTLADDALTREDTLVVERARHRSLDGTPSTGRDTGRPERFRLVQSGGRCVLVHEASGRRSTLEATTCRPR